MAPTLVLAQRRAGGQDEWGIVALISSLDGFGGVDCKDNLQEEQRQKKAQDWSKRPLLFPPSRKYRCALRRQQRKFSTRTIPHCMIVRVPALCMVRHGRPGCVDWTCAPRRVVITSWQQIICYSSWAVSSNLTQDLCPSDKHALDHSSWESEADGEDPSHILPLPAIECRSCGDSTVPALQPVSLGWTLALLLLTHNWCWSMDGASVAGRQGTILLGPYGAVLAGCATWTGLCCFCVGIWWTQHIYALHRIWWIFLYRAISYERYPSYWVRGELCKGSTFWKQGVSHINLTTLLGHIYSILLRRHLHLSVSSSSYGLMLDLALSCLLCRTWSQSHWGIAALLEFISS